MTDTFLRDLELLVRSRHPLLFIETVEKDRAESLLRLLADRLKLPFYSWTRTKGLRESFQLATSRETLNPLVALQELELQGRPGIYNFQGLGADLEDKVLAAKLKDVAAAVMKREGAIIITGADVTVPPSLQPFSTVLTLPAPEPREYRDLIRRIYRDLKSRMAVEVLLTPEELEQLVRNLKGFTLLEAEKILTKAMVEDGMLAAHDIRKVIDAKREVVEREGLLEYYPVEEGLSEVAGFRGLKAWLAKRRNIITKPEAAAAFGLTFPKGVLLLGVQGCGKSLCAKAVAADWNLPLLKMDPSSLYNRYIGETEKNFRRAMTTAERMAPVVLWIDEIEKAFAQAGDNDGGLSKRVLGTFLSWLQDRKGDVFVLATANDVSKLPPELIRKGRFDEIFFVDLPDAEARAEILRVHLRRRKRDPRSFDIQRLAEATEGFSGADIETVVVSALYTAFTDGQELTTEGLLREVRATVPLSVTMAEPIRTLRQWASGRTVPAN